MDQTPHPLAGIDLNLLVALDALLRERSVTRAGARLAVTQPTMSGALARLRALLGDELLVRTGRTMHLTPLAESLEAPVRAILADVEAALLPGSGFDAARDRRTFTLCATDYATLVAVRPLAAALAAEAPGVRLRIRALRVAELQPRLDVDDVDLAIVPARFSAASGLPSEPIFTDRFVGAAWRGNDAVGERPTVDQLRAAPYLSYRQGDVPTMVDRRLEELDARLEPDVYVESFVVGAHFLRGTPYVTFLQERLFDHVAEAAQLRKLVPPFALPTVVETMCWHPRLTGDPGHRWLRERVRALAAAI